MPYHVKLITMVFFTISFVFIQTALSQEISYSGKVLDLDGKPIAGATVKVKKAGKSATTDNDGSFTLTGKPTKPPTSINGIPYRSGQPNFAALRDGYLKISIFKTMPVSITVLSIGGKTLYHKKTIFNAGIHTVSTPVTGGGVNLLRIRGGEQEVTFKTCTFGTDLLGSVLAVRDYSIGPIALAQQNSNSVFDDSLFVTKTGYLDWQTRMYNKPNASGLVIRLASVDHPKMTKGLLYKLGSASFPSVHCASIIELLDGTLLSVYFGGSRESAKDVEIRLSRKPPDGEWEAPISVAKGMLNGKKYSTGNPVLFQERGGKLFLFYKTLTTHRVGRMKTSTDEGKTWSESRMICDQCIGAEKNKPIQLADGRIIAPVADRNGYKNGGVGVEKSTDGGETWKLMSTVKGIEARQPAIFLHPGGRLQMICRGKGPLNLPMVWSDDSGDTWTPIEQCVLPANMSGLDGSTLRDGRHILTYNHERGGGKKGKGPRQFLVASISKDGLAWSAALVFEGGYYRGESEAPLGQKSYPSVIQSRNGLLHIVYTYDRRGIGYIVVNPYKITDANTVPITDGKWPSNLPK